MVNFCVSVPIAHDDLDVLDEILQHVIKENPDLIEFRLDYISDIKLLNKNFIKKLISIIPSKIKTILTFRDISEGGMLIVEEDSRVYLLKQMIKAKPNYVDLELRVELDKLNLLFDMTQEEKVGVILSYHDFEKTPTYNDAYHLVSTYHQKISKENVSDKDKNENLIYKFIFKANRFKDNIIPLRLCKEFSKKFSFISFCMGELGIFSRLLCTKLDSPFTYTSFNDKTAQGQVDIKTAKEIYNLLDNH
jgi:3-dehydroquinate dehydratase-1